ncbi:MAG: L-rhamnose mutarotase [Chthoniobacterales bacterium]
MSASAGASPAGSSRRSETGSPSGRISIFLHPETRQLCGYAEIEDEEQWASIASTEICQKWWKHMGDIMPSNPDHSPVSSPLREVFHLD